MTANRNNSYCAATNLLKSIREQLWPMICLGTIPAMLYFTFFDNKRFFEKINDLSSPDKIFFYYLIASSVLICTLKRIFSQKKGGVQRLLDKLFENFSSNVVGIYQSVSGLLVAFSILLPFKETFSWAVFIMCITAASFFLLFPKLLIDCMCGKQSK